MELLRTDGEKETSIELARQGVRAAGGGAAAGALVGAVVGAVSGALAGAAGWAVLALGREALRRYRRSHEDE